MSNKDKILSFFSALPVFSLYPALISFLKGSSNFDELKLFFLFIVASYVIFFLTYGLPKQKFPGLWIFIFVVLFDFAFIPYGFNLTDEGYSIDFAYFTNDSIKDPFFFPVSGGYLIFGFWVRALGEPFLLWSRAFFPLIAGLLALISFWSSKIYFKPKQDFYFSIIVFTGVAVLFGYFANFTVVYDQMPFLFLSLSLLFFFLFLRNKSLLMIYLSAFFLGYAVFSRFSLFVAFFGFLFLIPFFVRKKIFLNFLLIFAGLVSSALLFRTLGGNLNLFWHYSIHTLVGSPAEKMCVFTSETHSIEQVINLFFNELNSIIFYTFLLSIFVLLIIFLQKDKFFPFSIKLFMVLSAPVFLFFYRKYYYLPDFVYLPLSFVLIFLFFLYKEKIKQNDFKTLLLSGYVLLIIFASFFGSNVGIRKIFFSGALLILYPFVFMHFRKREYFRSAIIIFSLIMIYSSIFFRLHKVYIDGQIKDLTSQFTIRPLKGIYSRPEKVIIIEQAYKELKNYNLAKNYTVLNKGLIFPFLLDSEPYFFCWKADAKKFAENLKLYHKPEYLIFFTKQTSYDGWYLERFKKMTEDENYENLQTLYSFILKEYKPILVVQNFIVLMQLKN